MKHVVECFLAIALGLAVAGCSKDVGHKGVQLWENGPYWAETNIGAENPWDFGYYFWWGDIIGYKRVNDAWVASDGSSSDFSFDWKHAPSFFKSEADMLKEGWGKSGKMFDELSPEHDAAHVHWGGEWRMPTKSDIEALVALCDWTWKEIQGVGGYVVRGKGAYVSASIFLPAAGAGDEKSLRSRGRAGNYWTSVPGPSYFAVALCFDSDHHNAENFNRRSNGYLVRPVQGEDLAYGTLWGRTAPSDPRTDGGYPKCLPREERRNKFSQRNTDEQ